MRTNEFKEFLSELTKAMNAANSNAALEAIGKNIDNEYSKGALTGRQFDLVSGTYNDLFAKRTEELEARNKGLNKKGGKQMAQTEEKTVETVEETKPEVLTGEVVPAIDAKTVKTVEAAIDRVSKKLITISNGYLSIVGDVAHLYDLKAWEVTKHNNIYEMCEAKFDGMARGTVNNLLSIFKRFGDKETYKLTAEASNEDGSPRSVRSLLEQIKTEKKALKAEKNGGAIGD